MATVTVTEGYNIWEIVRLAGIDPVIVSGENASFTYAGGELTVPGVTQQALEAGLANYDHAAYLAEVEASKPVTPQEQINALKQQNALMQAALDDLILNGGGI